MTWPDRHVDALLGSAEPLPAFGVWNVATVQNDHRAEDLRPYLRQHHGIARHWGAGLARTGFEPQTTEGDRTQASRRAGVRYRQGGTRRGAEGRRCDRRR